ncbi:MULTISPECIES: phage antirepressor KilAC domain-containing protein [Butyricimonas]|uniref:phage antirepressor KilAC domain-containing protein n=1 Tax=Butyricimonas TaxID=574697 RepID=UPI0007FB20A7|nr:MULTISPECIES: phage antirepressor KilAC domain-containing protein [Butyricimonas]
MENKIYNYNGTDITFLSGNGDVMVNATEMAKTFGKQPSDWTKTKSSQEFIDSLSAVRNILRTDLMRVIQGGSMQGTWMHEDVAMEFARWLSPTFAIWCNDRIKELLKYGMTATQPTLEAMVNNPDLVIGLAQKLKEEREHKAKLQAENDKLRPKAELMDKVMDSDQKIDVGQAAKILQLPFGRNTLFQKLREKGVFFSNRNEPKQEYIKRGYFELKEKWIDRDNHDGFMVVKVLVTQKGLDFIAKLFEIVKHTKQLAKIM